MLFSLAYAEQADFSGSGLKAILLGIAVIAVAAALVFVPIIIARARWHAKHQAIAWAAIVWGLVAGGSVLNTVLAEMSWAREYDTLIRTGYYDPRDHSGAPVVPWGLWVGLGVIYLVMLAYALSQKNPPEEFEEDSSA